MLWVRLAVSGLSLAAIILGATATDDLPEGEGKDILLRMCANCHEVDRVTTAKYPRKQWADVVDDMVSRGAEGSDADAKILVAYLTRNFGKPVNINTANAKQIETELSFTGAEAELVVRYRTDKGAFKNFEDVAKVPGLNAKVLEEQKKNIVF